jgi:hypothetical protein
MTKYRHLPTGKDFEKNDEGFYERPTSNILVASWIVEATGSKDWEKIEKEKVKDYLIMINLNHFDGDKLMGTTIETVQRLSDKNVFKVEQEILAYYIGPDRKGIKIKRFEVCDEGDLSVLCGTADGWSMWFSLDNIQPLPEKKVLFITEDGFPIHKDDYFFVVHKTEFDVIGACQGDLKTDNSPQSAFLKFSTREAAEEWVIKNKPVFTYNEMQDAWIGKSPAPGVKALARERCGFKPSCQF